MSVALREQETSVNFLREENFMIIYTSDTTMMTKLNRLVSESPEYTVVEDIFDREHNLVARKYKAPKKLLTFRSKFIPVREMTEEEKRERAKGLLAYRLAKQRGESDVQEDPQGDQSAD